MLDIESLFLQDVQLMDDGVWIDIASGSFKIRRWGTKQSDKIFHRLRMVEFGEKLPRFSSETEMLYGIWLAEYGVIDWKNVCDKQNNEIEYSIQQARAIFTNPGYQSSLVTILFNEAQNYTNFLYQQADEDVEQLKES